MSAGAPLARRMLGSVCVWGVRKGSAFEPLLRRSMLFSLRAISPPPSSSGPLTRLAVLAQEHWDPAQAAARERGAHHHRGDENRCASHPRVPAPIVQRRADSISLLAQGRCTEGT